jgi:hypothetical protein
MPIFKISEYATKWQHDSFGERLRMGFALQLGVLSG